jgi:hypothetical protein
MTEILAFAVTAPNAKGVSDRTAELADAGATVRLACWFDPADRLTEEAGLAELHQIEVSPGVTTDRPHGRGIQRWLERIRRTVSASTPGDPDPATQRWRAVSNDRWVIAQVARSDFLVALDSDAVYPVWQLARANPGIRASFGLYAVTATLAGRIDLSDGRQPV